ncbi:MAG: hypothetical protein ACRDFZ_07625 [Candidatus Limnocylindria bacterium]
MSGIQGPPTEPTPSEGWPARDIATRDIGTAAGDVGVTAGDIGSEPPWDTKLDGNRRRPTTAEQAVPWLIGLVLALAGMLIVSLALIFSSSDGLLPAYGTPSPEPTLAQTPTPRPTPSPEPSPTVSLEPTPEPVASPAFAPLEITFMQRTSASGPIHLFSHDFAGQATPEPLARDNRGVDSYAWSPDGAWGIALVDGNPLALNPGNSARDLGDGFDGITFAADSVTAYGLRATLAGSNDRAELLSVNMASGAVQSLAIWTYPHPTTFQEAAPQEAQFADDGGFNRIYVLQDGRVVVWILGAPQVYTYDPATGVAGTTNRAPQLWSPNGQLRIEVTQAGGSSTLTVRGLANEARGAAGVTGLVSHVRWSQLNNQIVFTLTRSTTGGGVSQDLYLWDLETGSPAVRLTQDLRSMGGAFRGVEEHWKP